MTIDPGVPTDAYRPPVSRLSVGGRWARHATPTYGVMRGILLSASLACVALALLFVRIEPHFTHSDEFHRNNYAPALVFVRSYSALAGHPPSPLQFELWKTSQGQEMWPVFLVNDGVPDKDCPFAEVPENSFAIVSWAGEWNVCHAEWLRTDSLEVGKMRRAGMHVGLLACSIVLLIMAIWPNKLR